MAGETGIEGAEQENPADERLEEKIQTIVKAAFDDAVDYIDSNVAPAREQAQKYFNGEKFGDEEEGRSQVVLTVVRDTVLAMLPSMLRIFYGMDRPLEFAPTNEKTIDQAEQATTYVRHVFDVDNPGFSLMYAALKDGFVKKTGIFSWGTEEKVTAKDYKFTDLDPIAVQQLVSDPGVELLDAQPSPTFARDEATGQQIPLYNLTIRRTSRETRQYVEVLPPEEFIIARNAKSVETADFVGRRCLKTLSELVDMGYDAEEIKAHGSTSTFETNTEAQTRNPALAQFLHRAKNVTDEQSMDRYLYVEVFQRIDLNGDNVAELTKICCIGDNCYPLHWEPADEVKFAVFCPEPEAHMVIGNSIADQVMDLQRIQSHILRKTLDSLASNIDPRTVVVEGQVNIDDVLNPETGSVIRETQSGMVRTLDVPFVGQASMPFLNYFDDVRAARTGISKASQGLDPDVLQSTTQAAVTATMSAAQERLELVARVFAETCLKPLFRGLLREIIQHQNRPRTIRVKDNWVTFDPRVWDADMDMIVHVGLGNGSIQQKTQMLMTVAQDQKEILATMGLDNGMVTLKQWRDNKVRICELNGIRDAGKLYSEITPEVLAKLQAQQAQQQQAQQQQNPALVLAQVEAAKMQKDMQIAEMKAQLEIEKQKNADDLARDQLDADIWLRAAEIQAKYGTQLQVEQIYAMIQRERNAAQAMIQQQQQRAQQPPAQPQPAAPPPGAMMQ